MLILFAYVYPAHTDDVPRHVWDDLTARFSRHIGNPNKNAPFRGTLIDPRMFAIDVNEWGERNLYHEYCSRHPSLAGTNNSHGSHE